MSQKFSKQLHFSKKKLKSSALLRRPQTSLFPDPKNSRPLDLANIWIQRRNTFTYIHRLTCGPSCTISPAGPTLPTQGNAMARTEYYSQPAGVPGSSSLDASKGFKNIFGNFQIFSCVRGFLPDSLRGRHSKMSPRTEILAAPLYILCELLKWNSLFNRLIVRQEFCLVIEYVIRALNII